MKHEDGAVFMIYDLDGVPLGELGEDEGYEVWPDGVRGSFLGPQAARYRPCAIMDRAGVGITARKPRPHRRVHRG